MKCTNHYVLCVFTDFVSLTVSTAAGTTGLGIAYTLQINNKTTSSSAFNVDRALLRMEIVRWFLAWERKPLISSIAMQSRSKDVHYLPRVQSLTWYSLTAVWKMFCAEIFDRKESSP